MRRLAMFAGGTLIGSVIGVLLGRRYLVSLEARRRMRDGWHVYGVDLDGRTIYFRPGGPKLETWRDDGWGRFPR